MAILTARPVGGENSIEAAAFVLGFSREFSSAEIQQLLSLQSLFISDFPNFQALNAVTVDVQGNGTAAGISVEVKGVLLQRLLENGRPCWTLRFSDTNIVVSCLTYSRWDSVWSSAREYLRRAVDFIGASDNPLKMLSLQIVDKFVYDARPTAYDVCDVFNLASPYLTAGIGKAGDLWHVNQGWFETPSETFGQQSKHLNVLNITSTNAAGPLEAVVDHVGQLAFEESGIFKTTLEGKLSESSYTQIDEVFNMLHGENKRILKEILSAEKLKQIGL